MVLPILRNHLRDRRLEKIRLPVCANHAPRRGCYKKLPLPSSDERERRFKRLGGSIGGHETNIFPYSGQVEPIKHIRGTGLNNRPKRALFPLVPAVPGPPIGVRQFSGTENACDQRNLLVGGSIPDSDESIKSKGGEINVNPALPRRSFNHVGAVYRPSVPAAWDCVPEPGDADALERYSSFWHFGSCILPCPSYEWVVVVVEVLG